MKFAALARKLIVMGLLLGAATGLSGCVVAPIGPGWCAFHPYRCR